MPRRNRPAAANRARAADPLTALLSRLGDRVRRSRLARGQTVGALAEAAGLSRRFLTDVELGKANVSLQGVVKLATALELDAALLLAADGEPTRPAPVRAAPPARRFALVGLRGAGKTTLGRRVAERTRLQFVELDALIEEAAGMPLADLFTLHGESYYRQLERAALERLLKDDRPMMVATGGGLVAAPDTYELLRRRFVTIWLKATPDDHWNRVVEQGDSRPMQGQPAAMARLREILAERAPLYGLAHHVVDTSALVPPASGAALEAIVRAAR